MLITAKRTNDTTSSTTQWPSPRDKQLLQAGDDQDRAISVSNGMLPEMKTTEPYSPIARANANAKPVTRAGSKVGMMIRGTSAKIGAEDHRASSVSASIASSTGCTVRTTNGSR